ncbi:hypothetical protein ACLB2K_047281 [Fragaria x ananassa]
MSSSPPTQGAPQFVSKLINPITRNWDVHKLSMFFSPADIELILAIPLSNKMVQDRPIWHFLKKGTFTTNSAYFVARDIHLEVVLAPPPPIDPFGKLWKEIWSAKVPSKVGIHIWRSCAGILPTREGLQQKVYEGEMGCLMCQHHIENVMHMFFQCQYAQETWNVAAITIDVSNHDFFKDCLMHMASTMTKHTFARALVILWSIWKNQNSQLWEDKKQRPSDAAMLSLGWLQEFTTANVTLTRSIDCQQQNWSVPASRWLKCNCDGSFLANTQHGGCGVILRNEHEIFQAGVSRAYVQLTSPFHAELNALLDGMRLAESLHHDRVIFETDCLMLTQALQQQDVDLSSLGDIIVDMKEIMSRHVNFRVAHIYCEAN